MPKNFNLGKRKMATATLKSISAELQVIDEKKAKLRKAFEDLQAHSSLLSSPSLTNFKWDDFDSYFTSIQSKLHQKFTLLKSLKSSDLEEAQTQQPESSKEKQRVSLAVAEPEPVPARPKLKSLCEKMDGLGLRNYMLHRPRERAAIRVELADAWKHAPDPAKMVLDAMQGICGGGSVPGKISDLGGLWRVSVVLMEELMRAKVEIVAEVREKAMAMALEWKGKLSAAAGGGGGGGEEEEEDGLGKLCFLHLLAAFGLVENEGFYMNELVEYAVVTAKYRQSVDLCRVLGFGDRISDIVQRLVGNSKPLLALKFIFQFELTEKFPPVPLLKAYVLDSKRLAQTVRKKGKNSLQSLNEAAAKEISSLRSVIKIIEDHNLESEYPKDTLLKRVEKLEKDKTNKKRSVAVHSAKFQPPPKQRKQNVGKHIRKVGAAGASAFQKNGTANITVPPIQHPHAQMAGLLVDPYLSTPAAGYGVAGPVSAVTPYAGTSADVYGLSRTPMSVSGSLDHSVACLYPSESVIRPGYYDRPVTPVVYGGYTYPPTYHPTYYPQ